jgi:hypothetical protein
LHLTGEVIRPVEYFFPVTKFLDACLMTPLESIDFSIDYVLPKWVIVQLGTIKH